MLILSDDDELIDDDYLKSVSALLECNDCRSCFSNGKIEYVDKGCFDIMEQNLSDGIQDGDLLALRKESIKPQAFTLCNVVFKVDTLKKIKCV